MNNRKGLLLFILATFFCISHVDAIEFKPYVQISPNLYNLDISLFNNSSQTTLVGGALGAGIELYPWLAIEARAGGSLTGTGKLAGVKYDSQVQFPLLSVFAKPMLKFNDWYLYGLLGSTVSPDYTLVDGSGGETTTKSSTALSLGLGAGYKLSDAWTANLEVIQYHAKLGASNTLNAKLSGLGLTFNYYFDSNEDEPRRRNVRDTIIEQTPVRTSKKVHFDKVEVHYETNSTKLSKGAMEQLDKAATLLRQHAGINLHIKGFSDAIGSEAYNLWLSAQRAASAESYLLDKGVDVSRLFVMGLGEVSPVATNATAEGRAQNRRVEIIQADDEYIPVKYKDVLLRGIQFELESSELSLLAKQSLMRVAEVLKVYPSIQVKVEGHTDTTGSMKYNMQLSYKRALAVKTYLISHGIEASRVSIAGHGGDAPIANNVVHEGRVMNRRVEIRLSE